MAVKHVPIPVDLDATETFSGLIARLEGGLFDTDMSQALKSVLHRLKSVHASQGGKPTSIIKLTMRFCLDDGIMIIQPSYDVALTPVLRQATMMWPTERGLSPKNPQESLPMPAGKDKPR